MTYSVDAMIASNVMRNWELVAQMILSEQIPYSRVQELLERYPEFREWFEKRRPH